MKRLFAVAALILALILPISAFASGTELVVNGGFDEIASSYSLPLGWDSEIWDTSIGTSITYEQDPEHGNVVKIYSSKENDAKFYQRVTVEPNSYYELSCNIKTEGVQGGAGANLSVTDSYALSTSFIGDNEWDTVTFYGKTGPDQTGVSVCIRLGGYSAIALGTAWFDNVSVKKIDTLPDGVTAQELFLSSSNGGNGDSDSSSSASTDEEVGNNITRQMIAATIATLALGIIVYYGFMKKKDTADINRDIDADTVNDTVKDTIKKRRADDRFTLFLFLFAAFILRTAAAFLFHNLEPGNVVYGHTGDITCFTLWGERLLNTGFSNFYAPDYFCDYPPGYMYFAGAFSGIVKLFGIESFSAFGSFIIKLPAIISDIALVYMVYRLAKLMGRSQRSSFAIASFIAFNPAIILLSAVWGQVDSLLTALLLGSLILFMKGTKMVGTSSIPEKEKSRPINWYLVLSGAIYGLSILIKPQALMFGPVFAAGYIAYIIFAKKYETTFTKAFLSTVLAVISAFAVIIALSLPFFSIDKIFSIGTGSLLEKYLGTATSYNYGSIEAYNLMALLGGIWKDADTVLSVGISYSQMGYLFMVLIGVITMVFVFMNARRARSTRFIVLCMAFMMTGFFTLGHFMHERYLFPALVLLIVAAVLYNDRRLYGLSTWFSASFLLNCMCAFIINDLRDFRWTDTFKTLQTAGSVMTILGFLGLLWVTISILFQEHNAPAFYKDRKKDQDNNSNNNELGQTTEVQPLLPTKPTDNKLHMVKLDWIFITAITVIYAVFGLTNLGTTQAPETTWTGSVSTSAQITFDGNVDIDKVYAFPGIANEATLVFKDAEGNAIPGLTYEQEYGHMFRWHKIAENLNLNVNSLTILVEKGTIELKELAFYDKEGNLLTAHSTGDAATLTDEPEEIPETFSYMNGMYFDELYHARTAYEHLHGLSVYETSHPPLGKILMSLGIAVFGMNAFGWRIVGTLFGIAMVPIIYIFAKRLFKKPIYALLTAVLFSFDFMHYTQTRIATIDTYGVFFILLMFYYMYQYFTMNFYVDGLKKTLKPLALAGLFFGLGAASKWICFYAGGGLAVMLIISLSKRYAEYKNVMNHGTDEEKEKVKHFWSYLIKTLLWCCVFYLAIPAVIYLASYLVFPDIMGYLMKGDLAAAWDRFWNNYQIRCMFNYHSGLHSTHTYQAAWYEWPLILRPMWFYKGDVPSGMGATISTFGNPMVWWVCFFGTIALFVQVARKKIKMSPAITMIIVAICANLGPWVLVTRSTYIYHYFATVPFILLATVYLLKELEEKYKWLSYAKWYWMGAALALFGLFYPVLTGTTVPMGYINFLEWLPRWTFMGVTGPDSGRIYGAIVVGVIVLGFVVTGLIMHGRYKKNLNVREDTQK